MTFHACLHGPCSAASVTSPSCVATSRIGKGGPTRRFRPLTAASQMAQGDPGHLVHPPQQQPRISDVRVDERVQAYRLVAERVEASDDDLPF